MNRLFPEVSCSDEEAVEPAPRKRGAAAPKKQKSGPACALAALLAVVALHIFAEVTTGPSLLDDVRTDARVAVATVAVPPAVATAVSVPAIAFTVMSSRNWAKSTGNLTS